jgi:capsular polysaccharide biosynthesis protein
MKKQPYCRLPLAEPAAPSPVRVQTMVIALIVGLVFGLGIMLIIVSL